MQFLEKVNEMNIISNFDLQMRKFIRRKVRELIEVIQLLVKGLRLEIFF